MPEPLEGVDVILVMPHGETGMAVVFDEDDPEGKDEPEFFLIPASAVEYARASGAWDEGLDEETGLLTLARLEDPDA